MRGVVRCVVVRQVRNDGVNRVCCCEIDEV